MTNPPAQNEEIIADPFAADIFAVRRAEDALDQSVDNEKPQNPSWSHALPKVSASAAVWDESLRRLPLIFFAEMPDGLARTLARLLNLPDAAIKFSFLGAREISREEDFTFSDGWRINVGIETSEAEIVFEIENDLAARLVDRALGTEVSEGGQIRDLTPSEAAVVEFLALNLTHRANSILGSPLFKFRGLSRRIPASLRRNLDSASPALLVFSWRTMHESLPGVVAMYLAPEALRALQSGENLFLADRNGRSFAALQQSGRVKNARARLRLGTAKLSFADLAALEAGDVILLENHGIKTDGASLSGRAEMFLGDGENVLVSGELTASGAASDDSFEENAAADDNKILVRRLTSNVAWQILIENLTAENPAALEKSMTETDGNLTNEATEANAGDEGRLAAESIAVNLRVEIEARRLSLAEIGNLRENQILELGARPTDTVNLLVDDQKIGRGELVLVEDRLGVRITKLLR